MAQFFGKRSALRSVDEDFGCFPCFHGAEMFLWSPGSGPDVQSQSFYPADHLD